MFFIPSLVMAQHYTDIIEIPNKNSDQLYLAAKEWFGLNFNTSKNKIQWDDLALKKIIANGKRQIEYQCTNGKMHMDIFYTIGAELKEGKFKYDIFSTKLSMGKWPNSTYNRLKKSVEKDELRLKRMQDKQKVSRKNSKKSCEECLKSGKEAIEKIEAQLHEVIDELTLALKK